MAEEELVNKIEILLFLEAEEIKIDDIVRKTKAKKEEVEKAINILIEKYNKIDTTLTIVKRDNSYLMTIKAKYLPLAKEFTKERELTKSELSILVLVEKNNGIKKALLAKKLGKHVYKVIKKLVKNGFLREEKKGRNTHLWITEKYINYKNEIEKIK
jgi:chromosome segregation and condensation protein ScpB